MKLNDVLARKKGMDAKSRAALAGKVSPVVTPEGAEVAPAGEQAAGKVSPLATPVFSEEEVEGALGAHPQSLYLDQIDLDPDQPRRIKPPSDELLASFAPEAEDSGPDPDGLKELARSIYIHGLLSPLVVDRHKGRFRLVAGERRYWAVRLLQWHQVPAVIWGMLAPVHRLALQVTENLQRQDLSRPDRKEVFLRLADELGGNVSEVCRLLGISRATFYRTAGGEEDAKPAKRVSSGQLVKVLEHMKERLPNMAREDQERVLAATVELQEWIQAHLAAE